MKKKLKHIIIIVLSVSLCSLIIGFGFYYFSKNNIYGEYKIAAFDGQDNITESFDFYGKRFFGQIILLEPKESVVRGSTKQYFKRINLVFVDSEKSHFSDPNIYILDGNDNVLRVISISEVNQNQNFAYEINEIYSEVKWWDKLKYVNPLILLQHKIIKILVVAVLFILLLLFVLKANKITEKSGTKSGKIRKVLVIVALISFAIFVFHLFILETIFLYSGIFLLIFIFLAIFLILEKVIKDSNARTNILTTYTSLAIVLLVVEILLRLFNVNTVYTEQRNSRYVFLRDNVPPEYHCRRNALEHVELKSPEFNYKRITNSLGFCDVEPELEKAPKDFLIIALGDSFTEGDGAHADSTWLKFLERRIGQNDSINYRFINAGVSGSNPIAMYINLKYFLLDYQPDLVITTYGTDLDDIILRGGFERFESGYKNNLKHSEFSEYLYAFSFVYRLFHHGILRKNYLFLNKKEFEKEKQIAISKLQESIIKYKELSLKHGFDLLLVFYPEKHEIATGQFHFWDEIIDFANHKGVMTVNLLDYYQTVEKINDKNVQDYFWKIDGHHNAKGYEAFGNGVHFAMKNYELID